MKVKIDGVEQTMVRHFSDDNRFYHAWAVLNAGGVPIAVHTLPKGISEGDSFRTGGHRYEIIDKARNE